MGVDVSDRSIKFVELQKRREGLRLKRFGTKNISEGIVERGKIKKPDELVEALSALRHETDNEFIVVSLPEEEAFLKVVNFPLMPDNKIEKSLVTQLETIVPLSSEDTIFDFDVIEKTPQKKLLRLALSVFPKVLIENYINVFNRSGFFPVAFEVENQSIFRPLVEPQKHGATMVMDFGKTRTSFLIGEEGFIKFSSTINVAGEHIDKALSKVLKIDILEAEKVKRKIVFQMKEKEKNYLDEVLPVISVVKDEAQRILDYWRAHTAEQGFRNEEIEEIVLCGGDSNMPGLVDYFAYELKKTVKLGNPWLNIASFDDYIPEMNHNKSLKYVTAIGLALRSFNFA